MRCVFEDLTHPTYSPATKPPVRQALDRGLNTLEHAAFAARLAAKRGSP
jgi:hypothetical protein